MMAGGSAGIADRVVYISGKCVTLHDNGCAPFGRIKCQQTNDISIHENLKIVQQKTCPGEDYRTSLWMKSWHFGIYWSVLASTVTHQRSSGENRSQTQIGIPYSTPTTPFRTGRSTI